MKKVLRGITLVSLIILLFSTVPNITVAYIFKYIGNSILGADIILKIFILLMPCVIYCYLYRKDINLKECFKLNRLTIEQFGIIIGLGLLLQPICMLISSITNLIVPNIVTEYVKEVSAEPYILIIISLAILPAIMEEMLMRGIILYESRELTIKAAAILNGVMFGLLHRNLSQFFYAAILGAIFAYIVYLTNSLYSTIIIHFMINGTQVLMMGVVLKNTKSIVYLNQNENILLKMSSIGMMLTLSIIAIPLVNLSINKLKKIKNLS